MQLRARVHVRRTPCGVGKDIDGPKPLHPGVAPGLPHRRLLVIESDFYGFGDDWIVIALVLYATTFLAGLLFLGPSPAGSAS